MIFFIGEKTLTKTKTKTFINYWIWESGD